MAIPPHGGWGSPGRSFGPDTVVGYHSQLDETGEVARILRRHLSEAERTIERNESPQEVSAARQLVSDLKHNLAAVDSVRFLYLNVYLNTSQGSADDARANAIIAALRERPTERLPPAPNYW